MYPMKYLRPLFAALFPYRAYLEAEIEYLKAQLAQKQRRIDEMQEMLAFAPRQANAVSSAWARSPFLR